jgi:hypothetical protein
LSEERHDDEESWKIVEPAQPDTLDHEKAWLFGLSFLGVPLLLYALSISSRTVDAGLSWSVSRAASYATHLMQGLQDGHLHLCHLCTVMFPLSLCVLPLAEQLQQLQQYSVYFMRGFVQSPKPVTNQRDRDEENLPFCKVL